MESAYCYRLLTKYREIFPPAIVVVRAQVRTTTKGGNIWRYLVNNLFIVYPCFTIIIKLQLINF